ncbi:MAG: hypothetical protein LBC38_02910 [Oscillospiraceae bacterium]|jgi:hypothetical protein|nr:hypothetical protein [Oscillospiraceae bacterium]
MQRFKFFHFRFTKRKKIISGIALILAVAAMFWVINNPAFIGASATTRKLPIYSVNRDEKAVAISFDAAWGNVILRLHCLYFRRCHLIGNFDFCSIVYFYYVHQFSK